MLIATSPAMQAVLADAQAFSPSKNSIVLVGATGTGKGMVARYIHDISAGAGAPFVVVNGPELGDGLIRDTLFGHEPGAFTGAVGSRKGLVAVAAKGTLFIDELGDMPRRVQAYFLRLIQDRRWMSAGSSMEQVMTCRVIVALQEHPALLMAEKRMMADLRFRFGDLVIQVPRLAEHAEDIPELASHFFSELRQLHDPESDRLPLTFSPETLAALVAFDWPGNIRELEKVAEHGYLRARARRASCVAPTDLPGRLTEHPIRLTPTQRQIVVRWYFPAGAAPRITRGALADALGVSPGTVDNDRAALRDQPGHPEGPSGSAASA